MNIQIPSANLQNALKKTVGLVKEKHSIPILNYFLFEIGENSLNIVSSSSNGVRISVSVENVETGSNESLNVCIPPKVKDIMDNINDEYVTLEFSDNELIINSSSGKAKMTTIPIKDEYPEVQFIVNNGNYTEMDFPSLQFLNGISLVSFACSTINLRPTLQCVHVEIKDNNAIFVATDSRVLAKYDVESVMCPDCEFNIQSSYTNLLKQILTPENDIKISINENQIKISQNGSYMICPATEGKYPNFRAIFPTTITTETSLKKGDLTKSLTRVGICTSQSTQLVKMGVSGEIMTLVGEDVSFGTSAEDSCKCDAVSQQFEIGMNVETIKKSVASIPTDKVVISFVDKSRPLILKADGVNMSVLVMPVITTNA